jgi:large subunit ribosomal protein L2
MGVKKDKPTSPARRHHISSDFAEVTKTEPEKSLVEPLKKSGGRNNTGRMTSRHRGGGHKRKYRIIDFRRDKDGVQATVEAIEYDPNRTAYIALVEYEDGERRYILAPRSVKPGDTLMSGEDAEPQPGNSMPLRSIPIGLEVHNVEMTPGKGGQTVRSAGAAARVAAREGRYVQLIMPSGEVRWFLGKCRATVGRVSNVDHESISKGKAGRARWGGKRPHTRGAATNPVDHPMGGGEGLRSGGRHPCSRTGVLAKGGKTRKGKKSSDRLIVRRRRR